MKRPAYVRTSYVRTYVGFADTTWLRANQTFLLFRRSIRHVLSSCDQFPWEKVHQVATLASNPRTHSLQNRQNQSDFVQSQREAVVEPKPQDALLLPKHGDHTDKG